MGIYARETGQGMVFSTDDSEPEPPDDAEDLPDDDPSKPKPSRGRPVLRVVK